MADIDSIFTSNLDNSEKHARSLFGKLLISLRKNDFMKIYSLMNGVIDEKYEDNVLKLVFSDKNSYDMLNNTEDISTINKLLNEIENAVSVSLEFSENKTFDGYQFEEFLKSEFGKILTIK